MADSEHRLRIYGVRRRSVWGQLGLQNGDVIEAIGTVPVRSEEHVRSLLRRGRIGRLALIRRGAPFAIEVGFDGEPLLTGTPAVYPVLL